MADDWEEGCARMGITEGEGAELAVDVFVVRGR